MRCSPSLLLPLCLLALAGAGSGQVTVHQQARLDALAGAADDRFGFCVALDGDVAVVGGPAPNAAVPTPGSAWVYRRSGGAWVEEAVLVPSDGAAGDRFGNRVAVDGDTVVVGAPYHAVAGRPSAGAVYVFDHDGTTWSETRKLVASDPGAWAVLGGVVIDGDTVAAGAIGGDHPSIADTGAVYVWVRTGGTWSQEAKLLASDGAGGDRFGGTPALEADRLVVGAPRHDPGSGTWAGAVYVFERGPGGWTETAKLTAGNGQADDRFGHGAALDGDRIAVGAPYRDGAGLDSGAAYVFELTPSGWSQQAFLVPADAGACDGFGKKVALAGDWLTAGAPGLGGCPPAGPRPGRAYVYGRHTGTWIERGTLLAGDGADGDRLGFHVAQDGDTVLLGAPYRNGSGNESGSAYAYALSRCLLGTDVPAVSLSAGGVQTLQVAGDADLQQETYFVLGTTAGTFPGLPVGPLTLPLNFDFGYFLLTALSPNNLILSSSLGFLDAAGTATTLFTIPPGTPAAVSGLTVHHACLVIESATGLATFVSNPAAVTLVP